MSMVQHPGTRATFFFFLFSLSFFPLPGLLWSIALLVLYALEAFGTCPSHSLSFVLPALARASKGL